MTKWETEIFDCAIGEKVKSEYRKLLSVKLSGEDAENILVNHFEPYFSADLMMERRFWMALSLCEWQMGRLTQTAKKNAKNGLSFQVMIYPFQPKRP